MQKGCPERVGLEFEALQGATLTSENAVWLKKAPNITHPGRVDMLIPEQC